MILKNLQTKLSETQFISLSAITAAVILMLVPTLIAAAEAGVSGSQATFYLRNSAELGRAGDVEGSIRACDEIVRLKYASVGEVRKCYQKALANIKGNEPLEMCNQVYTGNAYFGTLYKESCIVNLGIKAKNVNYCNEIKNIRSKHICIAEIARITDNKMLCKNISYPNKLEIFFGCLEISFDCGTDECICERRVDVLDNNVQTKLGIFDALPEFACTPRD